MDGKEMRYSRRLWSAGQVAIVLSIVAAVVYWARFAPLPVVSHIAERGDIVAEVMGTGTLEARVKATISPKISGRVAAVLVDQGDRVSEAQMLVQLDDDELRQQVEIAVASVAAAQAALDRLNADRDRARAVLQQAEFDYNRTRGLYQQDTAASVEIEKATEALGIARAELARAEAAIVEGQKELVAEEKTLAYHQARLADTKLNAPFAGLIVKRHREPGDVVVTGSPVLTLIATQELWISAWVDETEMARLAPDQPARVVFRSEPNASYRGRVARLAREADRETREFVVDVHVLERPENWAVGQRADVYIQTDQKLDAMVLPVAYLAPRDGRLGVFVNENGRAAWRTLEIGLRSRETVEAAIGLQPGDLAVMPVDPHTRLQDGRRIERAP